MWDRAGMGSGEGKGQALTLCNFPRWACPLMGYFWVR